MCYDIAYLVIGVQIGSSLYINCRNENKVNNYWTIMVDSLMAKIFRCIITSKLSVCAKKMVRELMDNLVLENTITKLITLSHS